MRLGRVARLSRIPRALSMPRPGHLRTAPVGYIRSRGSTRHYAACAQEHWLDIRVIVGDPAIV